MRKQTLVLTSLLLLASAISFAQVDDIKKGANSNKKQGSKNNQGITGGSQGSERDKGCSDACAGACCDIFAQIGIQVIGEVLVQGQVAMLNASAADPTIRSFELVAEGAYNPQYDSYLILPRLRGTYGIFATDFRLNYLLGQGKNGLETFKSYEWQILQLNLASRPHFNLRIGSGLYWQTYQSPTPNEGYVVQTFNEHSLEISFKGDNQKYVTTASGRLAFDYNTHNTVFSEFSLIQNVRIIEQTGLWGYFSIGMNYEHFYGAPNLLSLQGGLHFTFWNTSIYTHTQQDAPVNNF